MKRLLCMLLGLLLCLPCALGEEGAGYLGDEQTMLTVTQPAALCPLPGGEVLTQLAAGTRLIATGETFVAEDDAAWYEVYLPEYGYGFLDARCVQEEEGKSVPYHPGFGVSVSLFTVEDPEQYRVEVVSLDGLEFPVVELTQIWAQAQTDGQYHMIAAFSTAPDVCKTTNERLCATLYDLEGTPLEVVTLYFHAPNWGR